MADLAQLALDRVRNRLPTFQGTTAAEQLVSGRSAAWASLSKYVPDLKIDTAEAQDVMSQVNAWVERNRPDLETAMQSPDQSLPRWLVLNMGSSERVQQWIKANFAVAAIGLGPWESGKIDKLATDPSSSVSENWAAADAQTRLNVFGMIVKMDQDGDLAYIFQPPTGTQGFGVFPVWAIVVIAIALAAVVAYFYIEGRKLEANNQLMRDICVKAQEEGDMATVQKCIEATRDVQMTDVSKNIAVELGKAAMVLGGGYLLFRYALPWVFDRMQGRKAATV